MQKHVRDAIPALEPVTTSTTAREKGKDDRPRIVDGKIKNFEAKRTSGKDEGALQSSSAAGFQARPRKRTKTRSRQKNLRKDTRSKEQLPAHLTEDTLLAGRMAPKGEAVTELAPRH